MDIIGIDVAKAKLDCCLLREGDKRKNKVVMNSRHGIQDLLTWLRKQGCKPENSHVVMEATGVYHEVAALALHEANVRVSVVNPAVLKDFAKGLAVRTKTDRQDSYVLARYGAMVNPSVWTPPSPQARILQALLARREALAHDLQREQNRLEKCEAADTPAVVRESIVAGVQFLENQLELLQKEIDDHINNNPDLRDGLRLLMTIPAVGPQVASHMLALMARYQFDSAEQLAAYVGLVPVERQSGSSLAGRARLSKAGPARIRAVMYMAAVVATRYNPHVKALYTRLIARGKAKKSAIGAAMRKLVHLCFGVLKTRQAYQAEYKSA